MWGLRPDPSPRPVRPVTRRRPLGFALPVLVVGVCLRSEVKCRPQGCEAFSVPRPPSLGAAVPSPVLSRDRVTCLHRVECQPLVHFCWNRTFSGCGIGLDFPGSGPAPCLARDRGRRAGEEAEPGCILKGGDSRDRWKLECPLGHPWRGVGHRGRKPEGGTCLGRSAPGRSPLAAVVGTPWGSAPFHLRAGVLGFGSVTLSGDFRGVKELQVL